MIVTYYSFKGGVGRSFTLVETAVQLAARGHSVAIWDLDLEAPGLQKIPNLQGLDERLETGTLDLLLQFQKDGYSFPDRLLKESILAFLPKPVAAANGRLSFLLPGRLDADYPAKFAAVDWSSLFHPQDGPGPAFFYKVAMSLLHELGHDILLIDSRTGYTDLGAICTLQLPDLVVLVFNLNEQNLAGIERAHHAVTQSPARQAGNIPIFLLANMVPVQPDRPDLEPLRRRKLDLLAGKGIRPHLEVPLRSELLLTDCIPTLGGMTEAAADLSPLVERIEARRREIDEDAQSAAREQLARARDPEQIEALRRRGIFERAKSFEEKVAELFELSGYSTMLGYQTADLQIDLRLEMASGLVPIHALVECKDTPRPVGQDQVRETAERVARASDLDRRSYQAILVSRSGFTNNAHETARELRAHLQTYAQLLLNLVDLRPCREAAIRAFQGTALERLYVEQDVVLERHIRPGRKLEPRCLTETVRKWLDQPEGSFLALLGDFGCGKTSFCRRLAAELAAEAREKPEDVRTPVLIDLREGSSSAITLENLLTQAFQRLSPQPFNPQSLLLQSREGALLLIFDSFDEMIGYSDPARFLENLRQILRAAEGKAKVLLTCRTHYFRDRPEALRSFNQVPEKVSPEGATRLYEEVQDRPGAEIGYLLELGEEQINEYLRKALPPPADWKAFREQIASTYNLGNLAERPFLLEIIVKTLPRLTQKSGKVTLVDLYETYCASWFDHTDFRLTLTREHKVALVEYLARLIWDSPENQVHYEVLFEKATEFFDDRPLSLSDREKVDYEVRTALFLHRNAEGYYSFIHRSFLEYFVARSLRKSLEADDPRCLEIGRLTREVAFFLELWPEAAHIPAVAREVLARPYQPRISENALLLLYFHARARLGPLVGPGSEGLDGKADLEKLRAGFARLRPDDILLEGADLEGISLPGVDLNGAGLEAARLALADFRQATLKGARLARASLELTDLRQASAEGADLSEARLSHVDARRTDLRQAQLTKADLSFGRFLEADLREASFQGAETTGAGFLNAQTSKGFEPSPTAGLPQPRALRLKLQTGHAHTVLCLAWSPTAHCLASSSEDATIKVWDLTTGRPLITLHGHGGAVTWVAWSPDGAWLASASVDHTVRLWSPSQDRSLRVIEGQHSGPVNAVLWSPAGGRQLVSISDDRTVRIWEPRSGHPLRILQGHREGVTAVDWSPDGSRLATASRAGRIRLWDPSTGTLVRTIKGHDQAIRSIAWSPLGELLASASEDGTVKLWKILTGELVKAAGAQASSLTWSPDGRFLAWSTEDGVLHVQDGRLETSLRVSGTTAGEPRLQTVLPRPHTGAVAWSPDGERLATQSDSGTIQIVDSASGRILQAFKEKPIPVLTVAWGQGGQTLASASGDGKIRIWDSASGEVLRTVQGSELWIGFPSWSPGGALLAAASEDGRQIQIWDSTTGRPVMSLGGLLGDFPELAWAADGKRIAATLDRRTLGIWDATSGRLLHNWKAHADSITAVAWAASGDRLASGSEDRMVKLWNPASAKALKTLKGHTDQITALAWTADGQQLASASDDGEIRLWDATSGSLLGTLAGEGRGVFALAWAPDSRHLASGSEGEARLWDTERIKFQQSLEVGGGRVVSLSWDDEQDRLAIASTAGLIDLWSLRSARLQPLAHLHVVPGGGFASTFDGYVAGPPEALEEVRFGDGWALYDLEDLPKRLDPKRVTSALQPGRARREARAGE